MQVGPEDDMNLPLQSLGSIFYDRIKKTTPDRIVLVDDATNKEINYDQFIKVSSKIANALVKLGVKKGDVVTIVAKNSWKYIASIVACFFVGATANLLNHDYTLGELKHFLKITQPVIIFCDSKTCENIFMLQNESFFMSTKIIIYDHQSFRKIRNFDDFLESIDDDTFEPKDLDPTENVALILTSSGTTGLPKCVMLTHANFRITMLYSYDQDCLAINENEKIFLYVPLFHVYGCMLSLASILYGAKCIILSKFNPDKFLKIIEDNKITKLFAVPTVLNFLAKSPIVDNYDVSSLQEILYGGASVAKEILEMIETRLNIKSIIQGYGMTEISGIATSVPKNIQKHGSVGKVLKTFLIKVCDVKTGKMLPPYQHGELRISGPGVMKGYLGNETSTKNAFDKEGFLKSGDLGYYDTDGFFYVIDRLKEIIKYNGFQVSPTEIENLLIQHPLVKDAGVVGIPDERAGEIPLAFVVRQPGHRVTEKELISFIEKNISVQKRLYGGIRFVEEIPKTPSGKIIRRKLKELSHNM